MGDTVSATKVGLLLHDLGYSLQVVRKTRGGSQSPDRNAQFEHINAMAKKFMPRGQPVVRSIRRRRSWWATSRTDEANGTPRVSRSRSACMTSSTRAWAK